MPRLVGLRRSVEMMLKSQPMQSSEAFKMGLVDLVTSKDGLLEGAKKVALEMAAGKRPAPRTLYRLVHK